jgi:hypothetical protein
MCKTIIVHCPPIISGNWNLQRKLIRMSFLRGGMLPVIPGPACTVDETFILAGTQMRGVSVTRPRAGRDG